MCEKAVEKKVKNVIEKGTNKNRGGGKVDRKKTDKKNMEKIWENQLKK